MGSILEQGGQDSGGRVIWGGNLTNNYHTLINNPGLLKWADNPAPARFMRFVNVDAEIPLTSWHVPFRKLDLWGRVVALLEARSDIASILEFGYDWRAPLIDSAQMLARALQSSLRADLAEAPSRGTDVKVVMIGHSMGGLVVRISIAQGLIHPAWIDRLVHVGTPLKGSPSAFRTACERLNLPLFHEIFGLVRRKNKAEFEHHLLECIRTFPSIYHLLPPRDVPYLYYSQSSRSNPLREKSMPAEHRMLAIECHAMLERSQEMILRHSIKASTIYTEVHSGRDTELEYRVRPLARELGYIIEAVHAHSVFGDGTVPADSAKGEWPVTGLSVINVDHMVMCNNEKVVQCLNALL
jgi:hypothetical protein